MTRMVVIDTKVLKLPFILVSKDGNDRYHDPPSRRAKGRGGTQFLKSAPLAFRKTEGQIQMVMRGIKIHPLAPPVSLPHLPIGSALIRSHLLQTGPPPSLGDGD